MGCRNGVWVSIMLVVGCGADDRGGGSAGEAGSGGIVSIGGGDAPADASASGTGFGSAADDLGGDSPTSYSSLLTAGDGGGDECGNVLPAIVRDFTEEHPDFEAEIGGVEEGIVEPVLGPDRKPVYAHDGPTRNNAGPEPFSQWYEDTPGVNERIEISLTFDTAPGGGFIYDDDAFFPIDDQGFGNGPIDLHNFLFTTEIHTSFTYEGGERFTFRGDDDLWVFIHDRLVMDIGGVHGPTERTLLMDEVADEIGIEVGQTYPMDIFHAERHTTESNFRVETTIRCFTPTPIG